MMRNVLMTVFVALPLVGAQPAAAADMVKEVEVTIDLDAIQNKRAAARWSRVADDLENAIVGNLTGRLAGEDEEGSKILIDIDEVSLANSFESAAGIANSALVGDVVVTHASDNTKFDAYQLTVTFEQAGPFFLPGTDLAAITTDTKEYYDAMIAAFADRVVSDLK